MEPAPGATIGGRYRVERRAWSTGSGSVWQAFDAVLERPVLIQILPGADPEAVARAVARTAQVNHPGVCQIYDMGADPPRIVFEHAPAGRLADRTDGALTVPRAAAAVSQLASAIAALHERGIAHGAIGPDTVLFDEEGRPKLAAAGLREELGEAVAPAPAAYRPADAEATASDRDRYALGAVAYRLFTGREPGPDAPPARTANRGVPPQIDALLSRALARDPAVWPRLDEFRRTLDPIASAEPPERGPGFFRQEARWLVPVVVVIGIAVAAMVIGVRTGAIHFGSGGTTKASRSPTSAALPILSVEDFDPRPRGNGEEHHAQVAFVTDGKDTAWSTQGYANAALGGQKKGVGLLFDLGESRSVGRIVVRTPGEGWEAEWRAAESKGSRADDYQLVTRFKATGDPITLEPPARDRYWLLWITRLVDSHLGGTYPWQAQVSEVSFFAR